MSALTREGASVASLAPLPTTAAVVGSTHPDAELIDLCSRFDALERRFLGFYRGGVAYIENDDERDIAQAPIVDEQKTLVPLIFELPPSTHEGAVALARSVALLDAELLKARPGHYTDEVLIATLVRGLIGGAL